MDFDPSDVHETTKDICLGSLSPNDITSADDRTLTTNWDKEPIETAALPPLTDAVVFNAVETVERGVLSTDVGRNSIDGLLPELTAGKLRPSDGIVMKASPSNTVVEVKLSGFELPRLWFKMVWCTLITLHVLSKHFDATGLACGVLAALHLGRASFCVLLSFKERELIFRPKARVTRIPAQRTESAWRKTQQVAQASVFQAMRHASQVLKRHKLVGEGSFAKVFTIQEVVVVLSQTYQAYRCSNLVSQSWINALYVAMVIANCWGIPVLCFLVHNHSNDAVRSVLLSADALLNMGSCFVIPLVIFLPYYREFNVTTQSFPESFRYDGVWTSQATMELTMVLALSKLDLFSKALNHLSVLSSLIGVSSLLLQRSRVLSSSVGVIPAQSRTTEKAISGTGQQSRLEKILHAFLIVWAMAIVLYGYAENWTKTHPLGCKSRTHPWFSDGFPCTVFIFNCYQQQTESPTESDLVILDSKKLLYLTFAHCPALRVPSTIDQFPLMRGFTVYNCTIAEWSSESAIVSTIHKSLTAVIVARSNMSSFPEGLMQSLPPTVATVILSHSNLTSLPTDLHERWQSISSFMVANSQLRELPTKIFQLRALAFFFPGNLIQQMPLLDSVQKVIYLLDMSKNPLQALPSTISPSAFIGFLNVEATNISGFPQWLRMNVKVGSAVGSPYCSLPAASRNVTNMACTTTPQSAVGNLDIAALDAIFPCVG